METQTQTSTDRDVERARGRLDEAVLNVAHAAREYYDDTAVPGLAEGEEAESRVALKGALDAWTAASEEFLRAVRASGVAS